ncbi:hypothetical protein [Burkholderia sp. BDU5]|nr:hypothetical protein [Burkholderia sp. BDU5]
MMNKDCPGVSSERPERTPALLENPNDRCESRVIPNENRMACFVRFFRK